MLPPETMATKGPSPARPESAGATRTSSWLATSGATRPARRRGAWWTLVTDWQGHALPVTLQARIARADARLAQLTAQIDELETQQQAAVAAAAPDSAVQRLVHLKGVATTGASTLLDEGLVWRDFRNRREIGGLRTHYRSRLMAVDAAGSAEEVFDRILRALAPG